MITSTRRSFLLAAIGGFTATFLQACDKAIPPIMSVNGPIAPNELGISLIHEHILVDFGGAASYNPGKWNRDAVVDKVLPYLLDVRDAGCRSFFDCTPNFLGRDVLLLRELAGRT